MSRFLERAANKGSSVMQIFNPYTNKIAYEVPFQSLEERLAAVNTSSSELDQFRQLPTAQRIEMLERVLATFTKEKDILSKMITCSTGKPISQSRKEFDQMVVHSREYIDIFQRDLEDFER